jgi:short-subunit dehydrogenase
MPLDGKRIVVTGGTGGVGQPLVDRLLADGASVTVMGRTAPAPTTRLAHVPADLGSENGLQAASAALASTRVDVLVHLAGEQYFGLFDQQAPDDMLRSYHVNLAAPALLSRAVLPGMKARGEGHVIFAGSVFGAIPFAHFATYSSAKAGLAALALALSRESSGSGVTFTCAVPRAIRTRMASDRIRKFAAAAGFRFDDPAAVASRLLAIIRRGSGGMGPGFPESLFMRLHGIAPSLVSAGVRGTNAKARHLLSQTE